MGIFLIRQEMRYVPAEALGYAQCVCLTFQPIEDHDSFFPPLFVVIVILIFTKFNCQLNIIWCISWYIASRPASYIKLTE